MKEPKVSDIKKFLSGITKINRKYVTSERLSRVVGLYPEIINEQLKLFKPYIERWVEEQLSKPSDSMKPVTTQLFWKHGRELTEEDKVKIAEVLEQ